MTALSPDKGKGWVLVEKKFIDRRLQEFIGENFEKVTSKTQSDEQYLTYRENRVRRALTRLRDTLGTKDKTEFSDTISDKEYRDANTQASRLGQHIPLAKIHKFPWLSEKHGDGKPLTQHHVGMATYPHDKKIQIDLAVIRRATSRARPYNLEDSQRPTRFPPSIK